jgi:shikimate kinase
VIRIEMNQAKKVFLIGYMGSGKTAVGKYLAKEMGLQFIDLDAFIENRYHKTVGEIFAEKGETEFREIERKMLREVAHFEDVVISTGGGTPCFFDNMSVMNQSGVTIYLKSGVNELMRRLSVGKEKRPLIKNKSEEELKTFITANIEKREPFYNQATYIYDTEQLLTEKDIRSVVNHLIAYLANV